MVQIKLFRDHTTDMEKVEKQINTFLREHLEFSVGIYYICGLERKV